MQFANIRKDGEKSRGHRRPLSVMGKFKDLEEKVEMLENQWQSGFDPDLEAKLLTTKVKLQLWEKKEETRLAHQRKKEEMACKRRLKLKILSHSC